MERAALRRAMERLKGLLPWAPYVLLVLNAYLIFAQTPDDAFITYRYAANLVRGYGPVFNRADRVEGCSSPLHMLLSSLLMLVTRSDDILFAAKLAGLLCAALTLSVMAPVGRLMTLTPRTVLGAQVLVALNPNFAASSVNGLETSLYALVVSLTAWGFLVETGQRRGWISGGLAFVALLTRPDGIVLFCALLALRIYLLHRWRLSIWSFLVPWVAAFVAPTLALVGLRLAYYGYPLPNTFYAKDVSLIFGLRQGLRYLSKALAVRTNHVFAGASLPVKLAIVAFVPRFWSLVVAGAWWCRRRSSLLVAVAVVGADVAFVLKSGGDWMEGWRFCVPALPFMAVLQSLAINVLACRLAARWRTPRRPVLLRAYVTAAAFCVLAIALGPHHPWSEARYATSGRALLAASFDPGVSGLNQTTVGDWISTHLPQGTSVAYSEMGYAGMVNLDKTFIDFFGLVTKEVAHGAPKQLKEQLGVLDREWFNPEGPVGSVLARLRPTYILATCPGKQSILTDYTLTMTLPDSVTNGQSLCVYEPAPVPGFSQARASKEATTAPYAR